MGLIDKINDQKKAREANKPKNNPSKGAPSLKKGHLEWMLKIINDASIKGADFQVAVDTVTWLQQQYKRL